jgi:uncharacterized protein YoxC
MADGNGRDAEIEPSRGWAVDTLGYVPRLVLGALGDLRSVAESVRVLPEVARSLSAIEASVDSMDREVRLMRQGVDRLDTDVIKVVEGVDPLDDKLEDLRRTLRPLSRMSGRFGRRARPEPEGEIEPD